jgi:hypothetical protein
MVRPKKSSNKHLPPYLQYAIDTGFYRLTLTNGVRKSLGKDKIQAIQIANEYNRIMRPATGLVVDDLIKASGRETTEQLLPFSDHVDRLMEIILKEESPSKQLADTMLNDAARVKAFFKGIPCQEISLEHVNGYLNQYHPDASANVHNRKLGFIEKLINYAIDQSLMLDNPAARKMKKRKKKGKERQRLSLDAFKLIYAVAPLWLQTAMELALQASQARLEISRIKYNIKKPKEGQCGCVWLDTPANGIYGTLFIHRQKVEEKEASHVAIPIGLVLKGIIDRSRDGVLCPYIVHRVPERHNKQSAETDHRYQLDPNYLSRTFSAVRDSINLYDHLELIQRPTFHEIRALSARLFSDMGIDPQGRMAHTDAKSTKIYVRDHLEWTEVPHAEIDMAN